MLWFRTRASAQAPEAEAGAEAEAGPHAGRCEAGAGVLGVREDGDVPSQRHVEAPAALRRLDSGYQLLEVSEDAEMATLRAVLRPEQREQLGKGRDTDPRCWAHVPRAAERDLRLQRAWRVSGALHNTGRALKYTISRDDLLQRLQIQGLHTAAPPLAATCVRAPLEAAYQRLPPLGGAAPAFDESVPSLNEQLLLTGVRKGDLAAIVENGLSEHYAGANAGTAFGAGIYLAECAEKADQYTGLPDQGGPEDLALRALLGPPHAPHPHPEQEQEQEGGGDGVCYMLLCRTLLGYSQRTLDGLYSMDAHEDLFAMGGVGPMGGGGVLDAGKAMLKNKVFSVPEGRRELRLVPGLGRPYHSLAVEACCWARLDRGLNCVKRAHAVPPTLHTP